MVQTLDETKLVQPDEMKVTHNAPLTASEIATLWRSHAHYSMLRCIYEHFLRTAEDADIRPILEDSAGLINTRVKATAEYLKRDGHPVPAGFNDGDLVMAAPRLYSDVYYLYYTLEMAGFGITLNGMNLVLAARPDIREYYSECLAATVRVFNRAADLLLSKGLYIRSPYMSTVNEVDFVKERDFLSGFFVEPRPLLAAEAAQLHRGIVTNLIGKALLTGFRQVAALEPVRAYMARGIEISAKHIDIFSSVLRKEEIPSPMPWNGFVTPSTISPFSDRLIMFHTVTLNAAGLSDYTGSIAVSPRHDLGVMYGRLIGEVTIYSEDGLKILIDNGWFEEPPRAVDRKELTAKAKD